MLLIVDSGATKANWCAVEPSGKRQHFVAQGIHPHHIPDAQIDSFLATHIPPALQSDAVEQLFFYGAGCGSAQTAAVLKTALGKIFCHAHICVYPDSLAAARALFAHEQGIACILGTGSACCEYDGHQIVNTTHSLGYLLGDEGSATDLGKRLLRAFYYKLLPAHLEQALSLDRQQTLQSLYHNAAPAQYLASFVPFFHAHKAEAFIAGLLHEAFSDFIRWHIKHLHHSSLPVGIVGSVAYLFSDIFEQAAQSQGITHLQFLQYPIEKLADYHCQMRNFHE